jgi:hypothetical protein
MRSLVLGVLIGPISWSVFFLVGYLIAETACTAGILQSSIAGLNLVVVVILAVALLAILVTGFGSLRSYRRWRAQSSDARQTEDLATFLALVGTALNVLFALAIVSTALGLIYLEPCSWT